LTRAVQAAKMGHDVVLCPTFYCYFDYSQGKEPEGTDFYNAIGAHRSTKDWRHVYSLNIQLPELTEQEQRHIIGLQANAWGEAIHNMHKLEYMCFPRLLALSEIAWTPAQLPDGSRRDADEFAARLRAHLPYLDAQRVNYREESGKPRLD
ncbi:MAG: family 20 glycosylhydrolase, partial [Akkermansia muciniphila]|nr:family 20 glycosylhydrolase [Akkermansia muciniphila]